MVDRIEAGPGGALPDLTGVPQLTAVPDRRVYAWRFPLTNASVPAVRNHLRRLTVGLVDHGLVPPNVTAN